jgi:GNAT superfamily N-acetyltransferase
VSSGRVSAETPPVVTRRAATPSDEPFLRRVYAATRADELAHVGWTAAQKDAFLRQQFEAQDRHYRDHYDGATFEVVLVDGEPAGRLYLARWPDEIRVMDLALLPKYRNAGLGTRLLHAVFAEADARGLPVGIHVERFNPALRLYWRLGFEEREDRGVYVFMSRPPAPPTPAAAGHPNTAS